LFAGCVSKICLLAVSAKFVCWLCQQNLECGTGRGGWVSQVDNTWLYLRLGVEGLIGSWVGRFSCFSIDGHIKQSSHLVGPPFPMSDIQLEQVCISWA